MESQGPSTLLLARWSEGDREAREEAMALVDGELRRVAGSSMRREPTRCKETSGEKSVGGDGS